MGGIAFPIGVLLYWTTSNLWTMGQQFYVIRNNPAPNTEAARAKEKRDAEKLARKGVSAVEASSDTPEAAPEPPRPAPRQQPKKQSRSQRKKGGGKPPGGPGGPSGGASGEPSGGADPNQ